MTHLLTNAPAALGPLGWPEIVVILFVAMLLFGAKRLPDLAKSLGKSIKEFKKATTNVEEDIRAGYEEESRAARPEENRTPAGKPVPDSK